MDCWQKARGVTPGLLADFLRHATVYGAMKSIGQQQRPRRSGAAGDETALVLKARLGSDSRVAVGSVFNRCARRSPEFRQLMRQHISASRRCDIPDRPLPDIGDRADASAGF